MPVALSPRARIDLTRVPSGIAALDELLHGGLPVGVVTELVGAECSGRTTMALAYTAAMTQSGNVCAWIDVGDALDPETVAANGVDLERLLWVRWWPGRSLRGAGGIAKRCGVYGGLGCTGSAYRWG